MVEWACMTMGLLRLGRLSVCLLGALFSGLILCSGRCACVGVGTANVGETEAALDFKTNARSVISQDIPIINTSATPWTVRVRRQFPSS